jgi:hypothetical protein
MSINWGKQLFPIRGARLGRPLGAGSSWRCLFRFRDDSDKLGQRPRCSVAFSALYGLVRRL